MLIKGSGIFEWCNALQSDIFVFKCHVQIFLLINLQTPHRCAIQRSKVQKSASNNIKLYAMRSVMSQINENDDDACKNSISSLVRWPLNVIDISADISDFLDET